jgi:hypothetical protein
MVGLTALGTVAYMNAATEVKISGNFKNYADSFYIAEAGIQRAIGSLNTDINWVAGLGDINDAFSGDNSLGNGTYVVQVSENDPAPMDVRLTSTGNSINASIVVEAVVTPQPFEILNYATFSCGDLTMKDTGNNTISGGDVFVAGNLDMEGIGAGNTNIDGGDVSVLGNLSIKDDSSITNGNAFANGNIDVISTAAPNIGGDATAGGVVSGGGAVTGTSTSGAPPPVTNLCTGSELATRTITSDVIADWKANADMFIFGNYEPSGPVAIPYTGIVHITGNFKLTGSATFADNVIFIVDGSAEVIGPGSMTGPAGKSVTFMVPTGNFEVKGPGATFTIDGVLLVGTVDPDGNNLQGGNIDVKDGANLIVNGSVITAKGNTDAKTAGGDFTVNYQAPTDSRLIKPGTYAITTWREL